MSAAGEAPRIRDMQAADLPQVMRTEQAAYDFPWSEGIFRDCLAAPYPCWVLLAADEEPRGHAVMSLAVGEAHVLNLCVDPAFRGRGWGRRLLRHMIAYAESQQAIRMFLEVRASNRPAIALYESNGFCEVGQRRAYYPSAEGREDAVVLRLDF